MYLEIADIFVKTAPRIALCAILTNDGVTKVFHFISRNYFTLKSQFIFFID